MSLHVKSLPAGSKGEMTYNFEYLTRYFRFFKYGMSILIWSCLQLSCKLNLDRTVYTVFQNIRYSSKNLNVLNAVFSKQNISCFEISCPRLIRSIDVFFMHNASAVDVYRAERKHINYSIWPMRSSRHDSRRRYSKLHAISACSHFTLIACLQTNAVKVLRN